MFFKRLLLFLGIVWSAIVLYCCCMKYCITVYALKSHCVYLQSLVEHHYMFAVLMYSLTYIIGVGLSLPVAGILMLSGGFLFGVMPGALYAIISATIGAACACLFVRYVIGNKIQRFYSTQLASFNAALERDGVYYLLAIHFVAVVPFFLINILVGLTRVSLRTFMWTTAIGIIPGVFVYAYAGQQLMYIESMRDILSFRVLIAFVLLGFLSLMPVIINYGMSFIRSKREI